MTNAQIDVCPFAKPRTLKEWATGLGIVLMLVTVAGCERSQRLSQSLFPSLAPSLALSSMPAEEAAARKPTLITKASAPSKTPGATAKTVVASLAGATPSVQPTAMDEVTPTQDDTEAPVIVAQALNSAATLAPDAIDAEGQSSTDLAEPGDQAAIEKLSRRIAKELAVICPMGDPADQAAFEACKQAMYTGSRLRDVLLPVTLWGRQGKEASTPLGETNLTQFSPDVLTGMYVPLFMFSGSSKVEWNAREKLFRVELGAAFRNRLLPGQFPYPFWHNDEKWGTYQRANAILLWIDPKSKKVRTAQFITRGTESPSVVVVPYDQPKFDGQWMWTDDDGVQQPKVTLFDGLFRKDNPYIKKVDASYKELANSLREGECATCHQPSNPAKMKRLVLLQTPAHAAGEVKRLIKSVEADQMPLDETSRMPKVLDPAVKAALLARAKSFDALIEKAKAWEAGKAAKTATASP